jgi:hypothetical protein
MAKMEVLNAKLAEYLKDPKRKSLNLSRIKLDAEGAKLVAVFLPKW